MTLAEILEDATHFELPLIRAYLSQFAEVRAKGDKAVIDAARWILTDDDLRSEQKVVLVIELLKGV